MHKHDNIIIVHRGALGDFFLAWPALRQLRLGLPHQPAYWHGRSDRLPWLAPLGIQPCPAPLAAAVESLHPGGPWPAALERSLVAWFGLAATAPMQDERLWYLQGLRSVDVQATVSVCQSYSLQLEGKGIHRTQDWKIGWRQALPAWDGPGAKRLALLFPGAGHKLKQWPLVKFLELAHRLEELGLSPLFVLGPAEVERGLDTDGKPSVRLENPLHLQDLLLSARVAIGNDCGPMHLAGRLGVPGVAVFGPTSRTMWAPEGITALAAPSDLVPCRPCTLTTHDLRCQDAICLRAISVDMVMHAVEDTL
ncbi:glycosyltransferase family 9 protein [Desulfocurvibacter africanus]|uniref:Glycosyl transferase family 9 n=1 Tax=Desulfocurvibacter africanus subsp. africanus str. Walvis Bay TaxID=690850 RepID=F3YVB7_DESAF|nr:glycosyltransferase family 9 protein [Desulfocurvibacter africanus]EGJ48509.1 glycosyl transferase family 9 [Desulfocurvibacter africanus subsp. africanus str. Walvis Bay]